MFICRTAPSKHNNFVELILFLSSFIWNKTNWIEIREKFIKFIVPIFDCSACIRSNALPFRISYNFRWNCNVMEISYGIVIWFTITSMIAREKPPYSNNNPNFISWISFGSKVVPNQILIIERSINSVQNCGLYRQFSWVYVCVCVCKFLISD